MVCRNQIQDLRSKPSFGLVSVGNAVNNGHGLILSTLVKEELWGLKQSEDEESDDKHGKRNEANEYNKVPPSLVYGILGNKVPGD
jgi:hypothetical protein